MSLITDAQGIISYSLHYTNPKNSVKRVLKGRQFPTGKLFLVAIGKAAWDMACGCIEVMGDRLDQGIIITKYNHAKGELPRCRIFEAGHPVPDENSLNATRAVMELAKQAGRDDNILFMISGGGSALFEQPLIPLNEMMDLTQQMLACGADIKEINTIRKHLSKVKGGRFAQICAPAKILSIVLSDVLGNNLDMIASGPAYADSSTSEEALSLVRKYDLKLSDQAMKFLDHETPKVLNNVETQIVGSVRALCMAASQKCEELGYRTVFLTDQLSCEAREAGAFMAAIAKSHQNPPSPIAFIAGGETVVHIKGNGMGGRNQELALAAAQGMEHIKNALLLSIGSDGTDGPTDAAGGWVDGHTVDALQEKGIDLFGVLENNDSYNALKAVDCLIITGATGTNVNDLTVLLLKPENAGAG